VVRLDTMYTEPRCAVVAVGGVLARASADGSWERSCVADIRTGEARDAMSVCHIRT
jgi:hypothetical protein